MMAFSGLDYDMFSHGGNTFITEREVGSGDSSEDSSGNGIGGSGSSSSGGDSSGSGIDSSSRDNSGNVV